MKSLPRILFERCINILAWEMASPRNRHCANCISALVPYVPYVPHEDSIGRVLIPLIPQTVSSPHRQFNH